MIDTGPGRNKVDGWVEGSWRSPGCTFTPPASRSWVAGRRPQRLVGLIETLVGSYGAGAWLSAADVEPHLGEAGGVPPGS